MIYCRNHSNSKLLKRQLLRLTGLRWKSRSLYARDKRLKINSKSFSTKSTNCMSTSLVMPLLKANSRSPWSAPVQTVVSVRNSPKNKRPKSSHSSKSKRNLSNNSGSRNWSTTKKCKKTDKIKFRLKKI
jgi:hypothetical protein